MPRSTSVRRPTKSSSQKDGFVDHLSGPPGALDRDAVDATVAPVFGRSGDLGGKSPSMIYG